MVTHDEVGGWGDDEFGLGAVVGEAGGDVGLGEALVVEVDATVIDADVVSGDGDDALDVALGVVVGVEEDDDVTVVDLSDVEGEFIDEEAILVLKTGVHAGSLYADRLVEEDDDEGGDADGEQEVAEPGAEGAFGGRWFGRGSRLRDKVVQFSHTPDACIRLDASFGLEGVV